MRRSRTVGFPFLIAGLVLVGCSNEPDSSQDATSTTTTTAAEDERTPTEDDAAPTTMETPSDADAASSVISAGDGVLSDGVWAVGDAGTVEFLVRDGRLELIDATANEGWRLSIDEQSPEEIEVDFARGNLEYEIEIQFENGILEIEIDLDIDPAEGGAFELGPAGVATVSVAGGQVVLDDLVVADGWTVVERDTADGEVEIELRRDNLVWEFDAELDDGRLEVEIDFEIEGQFG